MSESLRSGVIEYATNREKTMNILEIINVY